MTLFSQEGLLTSFADYCEYNYSKQKIKIVSLVCIGMEFIKQPVTYDFLSASILSLHNYFRQHTDILFGMYPIGITFQIDFPTGLEWRCTKYYFYRTTIAILSEDFSP